MEQYVATLIPTDSRYVPSYETVGAFLSSVVANFGFAPAPIMRAATSLRIMKPGQPRTARNAHTGEVLTFPGFDFVELAEISDLAAALNGLEHFDARLSGKWSSEEPPLAMLGLTDGKPFTQPLWSDVACCVRGRPVSMSSGFGNQGGREGHSFGEPCDDSSNRSNDAVQAPCARFWIEIEFGKFLMPPLLGIDVNLLRPDLVSMAENLFETKLMQSFHLL